MIDNNEMPSAVDPTADYSKMMSPKMPSNMLANATDTGLSIEPQQEELSISDQAVNEFDNQRQDALNTSFMSVAGTNPDKAAENQRIANQIGVGQDIVSRNEQESKKRNDIMRLQAYDLINKNAVLADLMTDPNFASVAHDDIPQLSALSTLFKVFAASVPGHGHLFPVEAAAEVYAGFTRGTNTYELGNIYNEYLRTGNKELALKQKKEVDALSVGLPEAQGFLGSTSEFIGNMVMAQPEAAAYAAAYGVGGLAVGAATGPGALVTGAIGAGAGYMTGMALTAFRVGRGAISLDMLEKGYDEDTVQIVGNIAGLIIAAFEMTGLKVLSAPARKFATKFITEEILKRTTNEIEKVGLKKLIKETTLEYGKGVFAESATETMQDVVGKLADKVVSLAGTSNLQFNSDGTIQSANPEQSMREFAGQLVDTFIYTAKGAAVLGMFGAGMQVRHNLKQIATAKETTQFLTDLSKNGQAAKLKDRSPKDYANFVAAQAQGTAAETMYVDAEEMTNVLNQSGLTAQQIDNALPGVREQLSKATSGGDIQIPTAQFAANIVGTKLEAPLMEHARLAPDAISAKQAIAQQESMQQNMKDAQVEMAVQEVTNAQFVREAKEIEKVVNDQLVAAGRPVTEAAFAAKLVQARAVTGAAAAGITPAQWVARHPVPTFRSQQQATQQAPAQGSFEQASRADLGLGKPVGKQVVNIETNEFKDWFAGSVATVTKDGYPIKLYRWASSPFVSPELDSVAGLAGQGSLLYGDGVTLTTEPMAALEFKGNPQDGSLLEVVTRIKNPLVIDAKGDSGFGIDAFNEAVAKLANISVVKLEAMAEKSLDKYNKFVTKTIRNAGYDGVHVKNAMQSDSGVMVDNWVPFNTQDIMTTNVATAQDAWNFEDAATDQQEGFNESNYRPEIVTWAKEKFGDRIAPDGSSVWQNFTEWFGDSKVVDAEGKPMVAYHATHAKENFTEFKVGEIGIYGRGIYFSTSIEEINQQYLGLGYERGRIVPAYLTIKNPLITTHNKFEQSVADALKITESQLSTIVRNRISKGELEKDIYTDLIKESGHDGVEIAFPGRESYFVAFEPTQIKSAIANVGTFGQQDPNILRQEAISSELQKIASVSGITASTKFAKGQTVRTGREFKLKLQQRVNEAAKAAGIDLSVYNPETKAYLVNMAVTDAIAALNTESGKLAIGWYNRKVRKALRKLALVHPEILTDPNAKLAFMWALAVTSNGMKVLPNFRMAEKAYRKYKATGKMPTNIGAGTSKKSINSSLSLYNKLIKKYGFEKLLEFMTTKHTVKEVEAFSGRSVSGENAGTIVYGSAFLGAKVGNGFFANLYGHFEQLTIDRWLMRTWGRWRGTLIETNREAANTRLNQLVQISSMLTKSQQDKLSKIVGVKLNFDKPLLVAKAVSDASADADTRELINGIGTSKSLIQQMRSVLGNPKKGSVRVGVGDEIRKASVSAIKHLDGQIEAPRNAGERGQIREVFQEALAKLQQTYPNLDMADFQAVLWYPEKTLYESAKGAVGVEAEYEEGNAPDYDNAATTVAKENGVSEQLIRRADIAVDKELRAEDSARRAGRGTQRGGTSGVLNQSAVPATFYSALGVEVGKSTTKSASADSWKQQIKGLIAKGVVKEKEVYWSGLDNWLDLQEGKITKEQVQAFLDAGGVKVEVQQKSDDLALKEAVETGTAQAYLALQDAGAMTEDLKSAFNELEELNAGVGNQYRRGQLHSIIDEVLDAEFGTRIDDYIEGEYEGEGSDAPTKYSRYQLPGGKNYREALVTLPINMQREDAVKDLRIKQLSDKLNALELEIQSTPLNARSELRRQQRNTQTQLDMVYAEPIEKGTRTAFRTTHWNEPNILVHLRMNDRVDADGKKVLFVEEVQSDWGQAGREKGFVALDEQESSDLREQLRLELEAVKEVHKNARQDLAIESKRIYAQLGFSGYEEILVMEKSKKLEAQEKLQNAKINDDEYIRAEDAVHAAELKEIEVSGKYSYTFGNTIPRAPFIESTSGWLELGLKQILLEAVNGGYDRVAFVDGDQSVQRYRTALTEAVDEVEITRNDDGTYTYSAIKGGKPVQGEQSVSANRINEVFGKAGSKQLLEEADAKPDEIHTIASGDIEIGGEGMRKFYDTIVPQALGKMLKKLGGDKIGEVEISTRTAEATEYYSDMPNPPPVPLLTQQGFTVTPALAAQVSQGLPLFQAAEGGARGEYDPIKNLIGIGKNADYSTVAHELAHWYVVDLFRTASDPTASEASRSDADILLKWFGIAGDNVDQRLANWNAMTLDEQRRHHEAVAYNWELYLHTGKAPSVELQGVFDRFRRWLTRAYKSIRDDLNEIYKQQFGTDLPFMTDEVRGVFDRMLASEEQIARREAIDNFKGMYQTQEESGMNDATWAAYQAEIAEAHEMAVTDLTKATVKQMEWLSGARKGILKAMQAAHNALRRSVQGEESNKMDNEPARKAERFFKTGRMVDPDGKEIEVLVGNKIDSVAVGGMYPTSTTGLAPAVDLTKLRGMTMEGGLAPDLAAEMFGFSSGDELIRALAELKPFKDELKERTDARMLDEHGGMNTEAEKEEAVNKALANEVRARIVAIENRYLTKVKTPVAVIMQGAKELARTILGRMAIKDIKPRNYVAAEARVAKDKHTAVKAMQSPETAGKSAYTRSFNEQIAAGVEESVAASEALVKSVEAIKRAQAKIDAHKKQYGDVDPAIVAMKASHQQVIQGQLAKEGYKILEEVDKALAYVKRIVSDGNRKKMGADHADQIEAILERFGLMGRYVAPTTRTPLATWAQTQQDIGFDIEIPDIVQESVRKNFLELTPEEFQDVIDTVKQIAHTGKNQQLVLTMDRKITFEKAKTEIVESINANAGGRKAKTRTATTNIGRTIETLTGFFAAHLKAAIVAQIMDGGKDGGPLWNYLIRSANTAGNKETTMRAAATKRISEILDPVFKGGKMGGAGVYFPSVDRSFNRESVLTIALNMGNESNMQRLLDGEGWTIEQVMPIIQSLTAAELNAVQEVWDYSETFKAEIIEKSRRTVGREPNWIEPKPLQVMSADGQMVSLKGGYYPVKYDPRASARSQSLSAADQALRDLKDAHIASTTRRSYTKSRVKEVHDRPLLLNLSGLYSGIGEVIHDLSWHEWLIDSNRLMRSSAFDKAVREQYGVEFKDQITAWIKDVAAGDKPANNAGEMALNYLRQGVSAAGLGFNLISAASQITGFSQAVVKVGAKWIGRGIAVSASNPKAAIERVYALSSFMTNRGSTQFRELNEIRNMVQGESIAMKRVKAGTYFLMMQMQRMVDIPTWIGAYEKQLSINSDEKLAIAIADQAVIDSQGGGMLKDLSAIERGGPIQKLFTVFYSFMNTNLNLAVLKGMTEKNAGKYVAQQIMLWVVPVVSMYMLKKLLTPQVGDDDEGFDLKEMAKELAAEELSFLMGSFMVVREFADAAKIVTGAKTYGTDYRGPAGLRMIGDTYKFATQAAQLEFDTAFRKAAINIIGSSSGLPSAQINRTIDGIEALLEGETENITAPLFGVKKR